MERQSPKTPTLCEDNSSQTLQSPALNQVAPAFGHAFSPGPILVGVTGIIFNDQKEILLFKHTYRAHSWSLPGGYLKSGEHPREALEREIKEESGLVVSVDASLKTRTDRDSARLDLCYTGVLIGGEFKGTHEVSEYGFFSMDKLPLLRKNQLFLIHEALQQLVA